jgi:hypothetical protein
MILLPHMTAGFELMRGIGWEYDPVITSDDK